MCADIVEQGDEIISVGQLNQQAKKLLENQFRGVSVLGEISNIARPSPRDHDVMCTMAHDGAELDLGMSRPSPVPSRYQMVHNHA